MSFTIVRCVGRMSTNKPVCSPALTVQLISSANITSAGGQRRERPAKPFDYRRKKTGMIKQFWEHSSHRMDENSRVIIIDGPVASGKNEFAQKLAKQLDFKYIPQGDVKNLWKCGDSGLTFQDLDALLPPKHRIYDLESFYSDPKPKVAEGGGRAGMLQVNYFKSRLYTYNDAMLHLLSTGQGVVCVRSPWSDRVFAKALYENGYMSRNGFQYYDKEIAMNHVCDFPRPHLVIYLDADVETTKTNITRRGNPMETSTKVLDNGFLLSMEKEYKDVVLPQLESHGELLVYPSITDITSHEVELMVEDIEALGPMAHSGYSDDHRLEDWRIMKNEELSYYRREFQDQRLALHIESHDRPYNAPEMCEDEEFLHARGKLYHNEPGYRYEPHNDVRLTPWWKIAMGVAPPKKDRRFFWIPE